MDCYEAALMQYWQTDAAHDIAHIRRVWRNAEEIVMGDTLTLDREVLRAAVVFHDLVNLPKDAPNRAQASHCLLYTSPSPRDQRGSRMPSSA